MTGKKYGRVIFVRHGESIWNVNDPARGLVSRFTGWVDVPLTEKGLQQAEASGRCLKMFDIKYDAVYTSLLSRSKQTFQRMHMTAGFSSDVPLTSSWRLNERHYGALVGLSKDEAAHQLGHENVMKWRKSWRTAPPKRRAMGHWDVSKHAQPVTIMREPGKNSVRHFEHTAKVPETESLEDCAARILPLWRFSIQPRLAEGETVLVVAHANSIRSLLKHIDGDVMTNEQMRKISIPSAIPLIYDFESNFEDVTMRGGGTVGVCGTPTPLGMRGRYLVSKELLELLDHSVESTGLPDFASDVFKPHMEKDGALERYEADMARFKHLTEADGDTFPGDGSLDQATAVDANDKGMEMHSPHDMLEDGGLTFRHLIGGSLGMAIRYADGIGKDAKLDVEAPPADAFEDEAAGQSTEVWEAREALVITDDVGTILYTNEAWSDLCGFTSDDVIGRTSSVLQGPLSDGKTVSRLNERLASGLPASARILNYRKNGTAFVNNFEILPIYDWKFSEAGDDTATVKTSVDDKVREINLVKWPSHGSSEQKKYVGPSHFIAKLYRTSDRPDLPRLTPEELQMRDSGAKSRGADDRA